MTEKILTEIHGRELGLDATRNLVCPVGVKTPALKLGADGLEVDIAPLVDNSAAALAAKIGAVAAVTGLACVIKSVGDRFTLTFTFTNVAVPHTDAAASGSFGTLKIFDFVEGAILTQGSRSNITLTADNVLDSGTTLAGVYAFGSVAATAHDGALSGTEADFAAASGTLTATAHVLTSTDLLKGAGTPKDGTATAADLIFNESCSAATSVANGTILLNGTATFAGVILGDD